MAKKTDNIENYPVHNPDEDESQGMDLVDQDKKSKKVLRPGEFTYVSFEDWLKTANSFSGKHDLKFNDDGEQVN